MQGHVDAAVSQFDSGQIGLSQAQEAALARNPGLYGAFRGQVIDSAAKQAILSDPSLAHTWQPPGLVGHEAAWRLKREPALWWSLAAPTLEAMTVVHLPDELAGRVQAEADRRGLSVDEVIAEVVAVRFPQPGTDAGYDALEAFIGSGDSGRSEPFDIHKAREELAKRKFAEGV